MIEFDFYKGSKTEIVLALGFFDCIHLGHLKLIETTKSLAEKYGANDCIFTFKNHHVSDFKGLKGVVNTYEERVKKLEKLLVKSVIFSVFTNEFSRVNASEFLKLLISNFNIKAIVCGRDYKFGYGGEGKVTLLKEFCNKNSIELVVEDDVYFGNEKVSTTLVKKLLLGGDVKTANLLLTYPYEICGEVVKDRQVGRKLGFPTANVLINKQKAPLKVGVYKTYVIVDGKKYNCITNYGSRPTYSLDSVLIETYIDGFSGDLYGKEITVYFTDYIRDCVKFDSEKQLIEQLNCDLEKIR